MSRARVFVVLGALMGLLPAGCVYQDSVVDPSPWPQVTSRLRVANRPAVILAPAFADERPQPQRCGLRKNDAERATVRCSAPPTTWLAELLAHDLRAAGFEVLDRETPGRAAVRVAGTLTQFFIEPNIDFAFGDAPSEMIYDEEADIGVRLRASGPGFTAERRIYVKAVGARDDYRVSRTEQNAVDGSVHESLRRMVLAIVELVNLAPGLGATECADHPVASERGR
jgi:hypothetical protein